MDTEEEFTKWYRARLMLGPAQGAEATSERAEQFYAGLLNGLRGLQDDFTVANVPAEANDLLAEIIEVCESDYRVTFGDRG